MSRPRFIDRPIAPRVRPWRSSRGARSRRASGVAAAVTAFAILQARPVHAQDFRAAEGVESFSELDGELVTEVPIEVERNWLIVPVDARGQPLRFILDTGATSGAISESLARRFDLQPVGEARLSGASGRARAEVVEIKWLRLGDVRAGDYQKWVLPDDVLTDGDEVRFDGIVGSDLLRFYDVLIDVPAARLRLYKRGTTKTNSGQVVGPADAVRFDLLRRRIVRFEVSVNGRPVVAVLDTGSPALILNRVAADSTGITTTEEPVSEEARGIGKQKVPTYGARIEEIRIGPTRFGPLDGEVADLAIFDRLGLDDRPAMLVGSPVLLGCPLLIEWSARALRFCRKVQPTDSGEAFSATRSAFSTPPH